ncbi:hypothetical protein P8452_04553 [Trifolium repens]|nr:hypothetical protein P8452_04553 [Trifolium repens]
MSGSGSRKNEGEGSGGGWASTFFKVAGAVAAAAAVAGTIAKQAEAAAAERESGLGQGRRPQQFPPPAAAPFGVQQPTHRHYHDDDDDDDDDDDEEEEEEEVMILRFESSLKRNEQSAGCGGYLSSPSPFGVQQPFHYQEEVILKVDGSLLRNEQSAGCGGYLSSPSQKWICGFVQKLEFTPTIREDETESEAILRGLLWVKEKGKKKVVVKTDCEGIANLVNSGRRSRRRSNDRVICGIRDLLNSNQWEASLSSISRGENAVADRLAHRAHSSTSYDLEEIDDPPKNCLSYCSS